MVSGLASILNTAVVSSFFMSLPELFPTAGFFFGLTSLISSVKLLSSPRVSVFMYLTFRCKVSGCGLGSFTHISMLSLWRLNCVISLSPGTPFIQMESTWAYGAMNVMYAVLSPILSLFTIICLDGFSRNMFSSCSVFLARQPSVSFMSYFTSSGMLSPTTVTGRTSVSRKATFSVSGSYLLLLFSSIIA